MYFRDVNRRQSSCPSISCPSVKSRLKKNLLITVPILKRDVMTHSERYIAQRMNENETMHVRDPHTQLKSPSSEELEALLKGASVSSLRRQELPDFTRYWHHQLLQNTIQNYNMYSGKYRNKGCLCKPVHKTKGDSENLMEKENRCACVPTQIQQQEAVQESNYDEEKLQKVSSQENIPKTSERIKVCLPIDLEKISKDATGKTIKLIIYGDKTQCDCIGCNPGRDEGDSSSNECLACTLARNPQIRNLYAGWSDEKIERTSNKQRKGFPSRLSGALASKLSFFRKKQKSSMPGSYFSSDKCAQTCIPKKDAMVEQSQGPSMVDKACSCICCSQNSEQTNTERLRQDASKTDSCKCIRCGKIELEKLIVPSSRCYQDDCLKWVLKMEAKQNYRQIKCILKEIKEQRQEIRGLHKRYTSLLKLGINNGANDNMVSRYKEPMRTRRESTSDEIEWVNKSKDLKNAINQSTLSREIGSQESYPLGNNTPPSTIEKPARSSTLSLFDEDPKATKEGMINDATETDGYCNCTLTRSYKRRFGNFWRNLVGKKRKCYEECDCSASKPIEICKNFIGKKLDGDISNIQKNKI